MKLGVINNRVFFFLVTGEWAEKEQANHYQLYEIKKYYWWDITYGAGCWSMIDQLSTVDNYIEL